MPTYSLVPHPARPPAKVSGVAASVSVVSDEVILAYRVSHAGQLVLPAPSPPVRTDGLWRFTCFELFLMLDDDERYLEFNFSPSTQWAAYAFEGYRDGMAPLACMPPRVERRVDGVAVTLARRDLPFGEPRMALTAVIEEAGGARSFWSLAHPAGEPDFHSPACFAARLPAPGTA